MLHALGAVLCGDLKIAISSSPLVALAAREDVLAGVDVCLSKLVPLLTFSCKRGGGSICEHIGSCYLCRDAAMRHNTFLLPPHLSERRGVSFQWQGIAITVGFMFQAFALGASWLVLAAAWLTWQRTLCLQRMYLICFNSAMMRSSLL